MTPNRVMSGQRLAQLTQRPAIALEELIEHSSRRPARR